MEWLETNGTGAFAMGTVAGLNTRRYHALLVASLKPPTERYVLLSRFEEEVVIGDRTFALGACQYPGMLVDDGIDGPRRLSARNPAPPGGTISAASRSSGRCISCLGARRWSCATAVTTL